MKRKSFTKFWILMENKKKTKSRADSVLKNIIKYHKKAKKVLELGVGIGQVLIHLDKK